MFIADIWCSLFTRSVLFTFHSRAYQNRLLSLAIDTQFVEFNEIIQTQKNDSKYDFDGRNNGNEVVRSMVHRQLKYSNQIQQHSTLKMTMTEHERIRLPHCVRQVQHTAYRSKAFIHSVAVWFVFISIRSAATVTTDARHALRCCGCRVVATKTANRERCRNSEIRAECCGCVDVQWALSVDVEFYSFSHETNGMLWAKWKCKSVDFGAEWHS